MDLTHLSLFTGIGGLDIAAEIAELQRRLENMTNRNDENLGMCRIWERRYVELQAQLAASQQRERAAVEDLDALIKLVCEDGSGASCSFCADNDEDCHGDDPRWHCDDIPGREWSGPQEAGKGEHQ